MSRQYASQSSCCQCSSYLPTIKFNVAMNGPAHGLSALYCSLRSTYEPGVDPSACGGVCVLAFCLIYRCCTEDERT